MYIEINYHLIFTMLNMKFTWFSIKMYEYKFVIVIQNSGNYIKVYFIFTYTLNNNKTK